MKKNNKTKKMPSISGKNEYLKILNQRFEKNKERHKGVEWSEVLQKLQNNSEKLKSLLEMEKTGGEPDVVFLTKKKDEYFFCDCSVETPMDRRNICYDSEGLESRKTFKPKDSAMDKANSMGIELLTEEEYIQLQSLGDFDLKTSSWLKTPDPIRKLGGALFGDKRFGRVFIYHNGASSYFSGRGFRGKLKL